MLVLSSVFLRLIFRISINLFNNSWQTFISAVFCSDRLTLNHRLLVRGNSKIFKSLLNASCCVSRLSFWDWVFRISRNMLTFLTNHFQWYFFSINWSPTTFCWLSGHSKVTESLLNASCWVSRLFCEIEYFVFPWIFRIPKNLLNFLWQFFWYFVFGPVGV